MAFLRTRLYYAIYLGMNIHSAAILVLHCLVLTHSPVMLVQQSDRSRVKKEESHNKSQHVTTNICHDQFISGFLQVSHL